MLDKPDDAVISKMEASKLINLSTDTLERMQRNGNGPKQVKLSERRVGYRMRDIRTWLNERAE
jgi:predicted DNA-binding transcriptional regulator AlpA